MSTIQMPGTNQPIDYDFINQLVNQVNLHDASLALTSTNATSTILEQTNISNKLKTFATNVSIPATSCTTGTTTFVPTPAFAGFSNTPIVVATASTKDSSAAAGCTIFISEVTATGCVVNIRWLETKTSGVQMSINLLAIGPTA